MTSTSRRYARRRARSRGDASRADAARGHCVTGGPHGLGGRGLRESVGIGSVDVVGMSVVGVALAVVTGSVTGGVVDAVVVDAGVVVPVGVVDVGWPGEVAGGAVVTVCDGGSDGGAGTTWPADGWTVLVVGRSVLGVGVVIGTMVDGPTKGRVVSSSHRSRRLVTDGSGALFPADVGGAGRRSVARSIEMSPPVSRPSKGGATRRTSAIAQLARTTCWFRPHRCMRILSAGLRESTHSCPPSRLVRRHRANRDGRSAPKSTGRSRGRRPSVRAGDGNRTRTTSLEGWGSSR
jgi:hypothetical protein